MLKQQMIGLPILLCYFEFSRNSFLVTNLMSDIHINWNRLNSDSHRQLFSRFYIHYIYLCNLNVPKDQLTNFCVSNSMSRMRILFLEILLVKIVSPRLILPKKHVFPFNCSILDYRISLRWIY